MVIGHLVTESLIDRRQRRTSNGARRRSSAGLRSKKFAGFSSNDSFSPESTGQSSACVTW